MKTKTKRPYRARIIHDSDAESPRKWDNAGTMVTFHRNYMMGDEQPGDMESWCGANLDLLSDADCRAIVLAYVSERDKEGNRYGLQDYRRFCSYDGISGQDRAALHREFLEQNYFYWTPKMWKLFLELLGQSGVVLNLWLMDHSGLALRTSSAGFRACDSAGWDWGWLGFIYASAETIRKEWGYGPEAREKAAKCLQAEVEVYDMYIQGDVWGFQIEDKDENHIDSCWGFYGSDPEKNGMADHVKPKVLAMLKNAEPEYWD